MSSSNPTTYNLQNNTEEQNYVESSTDVVVLCAADSERRHITIFNNSASGKLYIDIDNDPALDNAMMVLQPGQVYFSDTLNSGGEYRGIWDVAVGAANIREFK